ncbi:hypothetical protein INT46_008492 [Mucor plumbeus]|uniref:Uncharacterized protein n=1 Tax=Mucor plumbeus TaxID=97098 RepID=A0A8H7RKJ0_9FUNG|nr:hypothetical protein INT46_008492 [Mucor plumbeus]
MHPKLLLEQFDYFAVLKKTPVNDLHARAPDGGLGEVLDGGLGDGLGDALNLDLGDILDN